jgi:hypothetical protein
LPGSGLERFITLITDPTVDRNTVLYRFALAAIHDQFNSMFGGGLTGVCDNCAWQSSGSGRLDAGWPRQYSVAGGTWNPSMESASSSLV